MDVDSTNCIKCDKPAVKLDGPWYGLYCTDHRDEDTEVSGPTWSTVPEPLNALITLDQSWMIRQAETQQWNVYRRAANLVWNRVAVRPTLLAAVRFATHGHRE